MHIQSDEQLQAEANDLLAELEHEAEVDNIDLGDHINSHINALTEELQIAQAAWKLHQLETDHRFIPNLALIKNDSEESKIA